MKKLASYLLLLPLISFVWMPSSSCKKTITKTVTDTLQHAWQPVQPFNMYAMPELNSAAIGDTVLLVAGNTGYISMPVNSSPVNSSFDMYLPGTSIYTPGNSTPFITDRLCAYTTTQALYVMGVPTYNQFSIISYTPTYTDSGYSTFEAAGNYPTQAYPVSTYPVIRNKYLLTPVEFYNSQHARFDLLSFDSAKVLSPWAVPDTPVVKRILLRPAPGTIGFSISSYFCASFYDKFFVYWNSQFYRIDTLGNVKSFGYYPAPTSRAFGIYNMFTANNMLFAKSGAILFYSTDQGETWSVFNDYTGTTVGYLVFRNVGNDLYATITDYNCQIWKVTFSGRSLNFSELNNDGLESNLLTSIIPCGKYIYITTSTGVFYRKREDFDQLKKPVRG